jgi:NAD(P) transhydrogenase
VAIKAQRCAPFEIKGDVSLIATGSYPYRPANFPFHDSRVYDSDTIINLHEMPATMLVVGGGVVGCEYACMFAALGIQVTLIEKKERLISALDHEIADSLRKQMEDRGVKVLLNDSVRSVEPGDLLEVQLESDASLKVETILVSAGRCGNVESLGLEKLGIATAQRGQIKVNKHYQTSAPHIYAAGDVIGNPSLASTSMEQARLAMVHAFDLKYREQLAPTLPFGIYTIPECSMVGETEQSLSEKKTPYLVGKAQYTQNARGQIIGDEEGFLKLLFHADTMKLLGVHMIGELATEVIHVGLTALLTNATADLFVQTCYNYPTLTEMYKYAAYDALGRKAAKQKGHASSEKKALQ